jgi:hypothetical protein
LDSTNCIRAIATNVFDIEAKVNMDSFILINFDGEKE